MCLFSYTPNPTIATEDIICYKVIYRKKKSLLDRILNRVVYLSEVYDFKYICNKLYTHPRLTYDMSCVFSHQFLIEKGFHSYRFIPKLHSSQECIVVICKIPKGSLVYEGYINNTDIKGYVSNQIIILDEYNTTTN